MTRDLARRPAPAPLPYSSQAGRGEIPAAPPSPMVDRDHYDPDAPLREDDLSFLLAVGFIAVFTIIMMIVALMGGL